MFIYSAGVLLRTSKFRTFLVIHAEPLKLLPSPLISPAPPGELDPHFSPGHHAEEMWICRKWVQEKRIQEKHVSWAVEKCLIPIVGVWEKGQTLSVYMLQFAFLALLPSSFPTTFPCFFSSPNDFLLFFPPSFESSFIPPLLSFSSLSLSACSCSCFLHIVQEADQVRATQTYRCPVNKHLSILHQRFLSDAWNHFYPHNLLVWTKRLNNMNAFEGRNVDAWCKLEHPSGLIHSVSSTWHTMNTQQTRHNLKFTRSHGRVLCECECTHFGLETFLWE